jgi:CheY-like chemotaxis protein
VQRDDEARPAPRWSAPPLADPHRDVTGALHDVSNALTVLLGWVAEVRACGDSPEQAERALAIVEQCARSARNLARRAIGAEASGADVEGPFDAVVADVVEALSVEAQRAGVTLSIGRGCPGVRLLGAADASQVLTNLLLNAIAWTPHGGRVTIDPDADVAFATVVVQDQGPGVEPAQAPRLFEGGVTAREGGAGIGLKYARAVARAAGGDVDLVLQAPLRGARFRLRWPRVEPLLARAPISVPCPAVLSGARVLIVEDDADVATLLEGALSARGAHVVVARTARELAERARERHDAALIDLSPIAQDVAGAVAILRTGSPGVALVFISGSAVGLPADLEDKHGTQGEGGGVRWIRKPFEVGEVVTALVESRAVRG